MTITRSVADILSERVRLEVESIDRLFVNLYQPRLMHPGGVAQFFRSHQGATFASSALMAPMTRAFQADVFTFADVEGVPVVRFGKGQRKDDVMHEHLASFDAEEGVLFVGVAQEKARVFRTERRYSQDGRPYPWLVRSTAMVNHYYLELQVKASRVFAGACRSSPARAVGAWNFISSSRPWPSKDSNIATSTRTPSSPPHGPPNRPRPAPHPAP